MTFQLNSQRIRSVYQTSKSLDIELIKHVGLKYLDSDVTIYYKHASPLFSTISGLTTEIGPKTYLVELSVFYGINEEIRIRTLLHEMGHVIDMANGRLVQEPTTFDGVEYPEPMDWQDRPWEQSAEEWSRCLFYELIIEPELKRQGVIPTAGPRIKF